MFGGYRATASLLPMSISPLEERYVLIASSRIQSWFCGGKAE
jgi:hypothetical protein